MSSDDYLWRKRISDLEAALREIAAMEVPVDAEDIKYMQAHLYHRMRDLAHRALSSEDATRPTGDKE